VKFSELSERNAQALIELYSAALNQSRADSSQLLNQTFKALILGNLGGVALLMTFATVAAQKDAALSMFLGPVWVFLIGAGCAALSNFVLVSVSLGSTDHLAKELEAFAKDEKGTDELKGYDFSRRGRGVFFVSAGLSVCALIVGAIWSSVALFS
jgi:hypothetical protein